jgi:hypothetical protein
MPKTYFCYIPSAVYCSPNKLILDINWKAEDNMPKKVKSGARPVKKPLPNQEKKRRTPSSKGVKSAKAVYVSPSAKKATKIQRSGSTKISLSEDFPPGQFPPGE